MKSLTKIFVSAQPVFTSVILLSFLQLSGCSSKALKYEKSEQLTKNEEFEKAVIIERTEPALSEEEAAVPAVITIATSNPAPVIAKPNNGTAVSVTKAGGAKNPKKNKISKSELKALAAKATTASQNAEAAPMGPVKREPELEDSVGFEGRRPLKDPFRIGEVVTHDVHYFKVSAGTMKLKIDPMVNLNGRKAYNFVTEVKSSSMFSSFYSVDDRVENFVDYETLVPRVFSLHVKETSQLREARMIFDEKTLKATYWEKKVTDKSGEEEKKQSWDILPYSQNVFSAAFYMRNFQWEPGKEVSFRVADDEQNLIFKAKCLRRETLDTALGPIKAVVIKPEVTLKGAFKPVGDIYIWLSDDDRKYVLRIESKIKIGTIISEIVALKPGRN